MLLKWDFLNKIVRGPYPLTLPQVGLLIYPKRIGVFLIHNEKKEVIYVGRGDEDLAKEIKKYIEMGKFFSYQYTISLKENYLLECKYFHRYQNNPNFLKKDHPLPPPGIEEKCPICGL
ncbi:MAG: hypothetical protein N2323_04950 [candidate division WOR-3 bacterium]|nr:hypothetical protein [candidate division WOR-3 bacterium]MCX7837288.1 hypothetical protein [candidate division WOR-3 bacterium]MDW8113949.1 hypothetical protein [candidate division WOR-3 bacterium]